MTKLPSTPLRPFPGLVLAGTDTGIGKTTVARALLRLAARSGLRLLPFKPVESGCEENGPRDSLDLIRASSIPSLTANQVCPYSFKAPLSPSVASKMEGRQVELAVLIEAAHALAARADALLVEGAGGLLSPWGPGLHLATFAAALRLPILVVAPNRLGTISQTALVAAECRRRELPCVGFVLVHVSPSVTPDQDTNAEEIVREANLPFLGALPYLDPTNADAIADGAAMTLDVTSILAAASGAAPVSH